jgi:hypothetical protein
MIVDLIKSSESIPSDIQLDFGYENTQGYMDINNVMPADTKLVIMELMIEVINISASSNDKH